MTSLMACGVLDVIAVIKNYEVLLQERGMRVSRDRTAYSP